MSFLSDLFGPPNVNQLYEKGDVKGLITALDYKKDKFIRINAAKALGGKKDPKAVEPLIGALKDSDKEVRISVIGALKDIKGARSIEALIGAFKDADKDIRSSATWALINKNDTESVEPLIAALKDKPDSEACDSAIFVLGAIKDARAVEPLVAALNRFSGNSRYHAAWALGEIGDARAIEPLITVLKDCHDQRMQGVATDALKNIDLKKKQDAFSTKIKIYCSRCGNEIESLTPDYIAAMEKYKVTDPTNAAKMAEDLASPDWEEDWKGTICLKCLYTYCENCIKFGPGKCPNCGSELYALNESSLQGSPYTKRFRKEKTIQRVNG